MNYGGRGIVVCARWLGPDGFANFYTDMGLRPDGHSLERRDNNGPYSPDNCYWATPLEQARNKRNNRLLTANGKAQIMAEWARDLGVNPAAILYRLRKGWPEERAVTEPAPERPNAKLTMEDAVEIRRLSPSVRPTALARQFGVCHKSIANILQGRTFKQDTLTLT